MVECRSSTAVCIQWFIIRTRSTTLLERSMSTDTSSWRQWNLYIHYTLPLHTRQRHVDGRLSPFLRPLKGRWAPHLRGMAHFWFDHILASPTTTRIKYDWVHKAPTKWSTKRYCQISNSRCDYWKLHYSNYNLCKTETQSVSRQITCSSILRNMPSLCKFT